MVDKNEKHPIGVVDDLSKDELKFHQEVFVKIHDAIVKVINDTCTEEQRDNEVFGYLCAAAILRVAAEIALNLNYPIQDFAVLSDSMFIYEQNIRLATDKGFQQKLLEKISAKVGVKIDPKNANELSEAINSLPPEEIFKAFMEINGDEPQKESIPPINVKPPKSSLN